MERAFPSGKEQAYSKLQSQSAAIKSCRPKKELDHIIYVVGNWQAGVKIRKMASGPKRDSLLDFCQEHPLGNKYIHQYCLEEIYVPGDLEPHTVAKRLKMNVKGDRVPGGIVVTRETLFNAIDEWHCGNGHLGQERTWTYCKKKYWNVSQDPVKDYLKTCLTCMQKNLVANTEKGSHTPIVSKLFCDRFQIDLVNFHKLWKKDPIGVLMHWVMAIKDHATGLTYLCALPRKRPELVTYKLQEIFGAIGYPFFPHQHQQWKGIHSEVDLEISLSFESQCPIGHWQAKKPSRPRIC